ncbi:mannosyltransferase putative-domain-containing protein [Sphaerosporella brunnea]|uniref:Mannosyltransferase putative-domain-containing protein n=1 Tax=Sphaerosporella brunnea TaxID=1250544 RepID=A0A5J5EMG9_9PEZI|nr:mannosyltransferase putative-domain-containing protein [Sphaerosporella brunnea]
MPRFTTLRTLGSVLVLSAILSIIFINSASLDKLRSHLGPSGKSSNSILNPLPNPNSKPQLPRLDPVQENIKAFWGTWSRHIHNGRPHIAPLQLFGNAPTIHGQKLSGFRKPAGDYLHLSTDNVASLTNSHRAFMTKLDKARDSLGDTARKLYDGTGIVIVAGGEYFGPTIVSLRMIRRTGCTLPVEVFLGAREEYEPEICENVLPALNARCVLIPSFLLPPLSPDVTHYQLKSLALIFSRFREVLYLDSDSIPLLDPTPMFQERPFTDSGLVLWPDFWKATENPGFWTIAGLEKFPENLPPTGGEAGQILVDKGRHLQTLLTAAYYNIFGPGWYYELLSQGALGMGDKETFLTAAVVTGSKWSRVHKAVETVGYRKIDEKEKGGGMVQFHPGDDLASQLAASTGGDANKKDDVKIRPAFIHANTPKMNAGHLVDEGDLMYDGKRVRLWGGKKNSVKRFGEDIEKTVWKELVDVGCKLADVMREWKSRENVCQRLKEHWKEVFEKDV